METADLSLLDLFMVCLFNSLISSLKHFDVLSWLLLRVESKDSSESTNGQRETSSDDEALGEELGGRLLLTTGSMMSD